MDKIDLLYEYLVNFFKTHGYAPTYQEMADGIGINSKAPIRPMLMKLRKNGLIKMEQNSSKFSLSEYEMVHRNETKKDVLKGSVAFPEGETEIEIKIVDKNIEIKIPVGFDIANWYHSVHFVSAKREGEV